MSPIKILLRVAAAVVCLLVIGIPAKAQYRAGIQGTVTDSTGAVVKGVLVTVTDLATGRSINATTNEQGFYSVAHLSPGLYNVSAAFANFKTEVFSNVQVGAEQTTGLNITIQPGAISEKVTVSGNSVGQLQTEDASLTGIITNAQVQELPQFRGDPFELLRVTPGVFGIGGRDSGGNSVNFPNYNGVGGSNRGIFQVENAVQASANGSRVEANGYQLDGVSTNSQGWGGATVITPNSESVKEISVEVSPYSAENAHGAGAIVKVVSQNGTNDFHGSAVFRLHSPGLNAYQRWGGPNGQSPNRDNLLTRDYLGSIGGPILKNKLFFFFSFDHLKTGGGQYRASSWVETPQFISSLPSGSLASTIFATKGSGFTSPKILTVGTGAGQGGCKDLGLTEGTGCTTIPGQGVDIGSIPNTPGQIVNSATGAGLDGKPDVMLLEYGGFNDRITAWQYNGRLDYNVTKKDLVAFSLFWVPQQKTFLPGGWVDGRQYNIFNTDALNATAALLWTRTIDSNTINEARMNVTRWYFDEIKSNPQAPFGLAQENINIPNNSISTGFPFGPGVFYQTTYAFRDTLSKIHNSHVFKFGFELAKEQNNSANTGGARPNYNFDNLWSFANDAPTSESGTFNPVTGVPTDFRKYIRVTTLSFFLQDNWKIKPNFTLTYGLRYDYFSPLHEKFGRLSNLIPGQGVDTLTGAVIRTGGNLTESNLNNWGPQLGFAWSPSSVMHREMNNHFVLRGGIGLAYNRVPQSLLGNVAGNPPDFISVNLPTDQVVYGLSSNGPYSFSGFGVNNATLLTFDPNTGLPIGGEHLAKPDIHGVVQNLSTPYTMHYSMEGQYDVGHNWVASLAYEGSQSRKYPRTLNYALFYTPNPNINSVVMAQSDVNAHYNAMLATLTHRLSYGLQLTANYRYSKSMDQCSSDQSCNQTYPFDQRTEWGVSDFDVTHSFTMNALYELPFFKSRNDWVHTIAGGWKLSGILTLNSGFPWTPVVGTCVVNVYGNVCPSRPTAYLGGAGKNYSNSTFQTLDGNFSGQSSSGGICATWPTCQTKYFTVQDTPTGLGVLPPAPGVGRNSFRGPHYTGIDMSFGKRFTLPHMKFFGENAGFEIKANAFNVFNKLNLSPFQFNSGSTSIGSFSSTTDPVTQVVTHYFNPSSNFGRATGALSGRVIEFVGRFTF
jgi:hypothetical protein